MFMRLLLLDFVIPAPLIQPSSRVRDSLFSVSSSPVSTSSDLLLDCLDDSLLDFMEQCWAFPIADLIPVFPGAFFADLPGICLPELVEP